MPDWRLEAQLWALGATPVAGVDEAGRGALAGPVVAAAVILPYGAHPFEDSKQLSAAQRERMAERVKSAALAYGIGWASPREVDALNVLRATHLAAQRALGRLEPPPTALVTDYLMLDFPRFLAPAKADSASLQVAAASILAKTARDAHMRELAGRYPAYGFERHKGYGAPEHLRALARHGPSPAHRLSFRPVAQVRLFGALE